MAVLEIADFSHKWIAASVQVPRSGFATALVQNCFGFIDLGGIAGFAGRLRLNATPRLSIFLGLGGGGPEKIFINQLGLSLPVTRSGKCCRAPWDEADAGRRVAR